MSFPLEDAILILKQHCIIYASGGKHCELQGILGKNTHLRPLIFKEQERKNISAKKRLNLVKIIIL